MHDRQSLRQAALDLLKAIARKAGTPQCTQRSMWMVPAENGQVSRQFERQVFDRASILMDAQTWLTDGHFPEQRQIAEQLSQAGVPHETMPHHFMLPLVHKWLWLADPVTFGSVALSQVLDDFVESVAGRQVISTSRSALSGVELSCAPVAPENGVAIRPVTQEELWELGDMDDTSLLSGVNNMLGMLPSEKWIILSIEARHVEEPQYPPESISRIRETILTALQLASPGSFTVADLGTRVDYGLGSMGRVSSGLIPRRFGRLGDRYLLDANVAERLKNMWPRLLNIMGCQDYYLRLPSQRLVDGGMRKRDDEAVVDYAIGLEALLTKGAKGELTYRFALRGATILGWSCGDKRQFFKKLQSFYDFRSCIVHGDPKAEQKTREARLFGEKALRDIWWWYFNTGHDSLATATDEVDKRILR